MSMHMYNHMAIRMAKEAVVAVTRIAGRVYGCRAVSVLVSELVDKSLHSEPYAWLYS